MLPGRSRTVHRFVTRCLPELAIVEVVADRSSTQSCHRRAIALLAHENKKLDLLEWARFNRAHLEVHDLLATATTGALLSEELGLRVARLQSGPLGGDLQIGAKITEGAVDLLLFFWDPLEPQPHDPDVKALLRIAVVWNVPVACNRATADFVISSPLFTANYERTIPSYSSVPGREPRAKRGAAVTSASRVVA